MFTKVTEKDVTDKFLQLIEENGTTTTMDVKKALRNDGFWVFQRTVSSIIHDNFNQLGTQRAYNGEYCIYSMVESRDEVNDTVDDTVDSGDESDESGEIDNTVKRAKIITELTMIADDTYQLTILVNGVTVDLVIATDDSLSVYGDLTYKVFDTTGRTWYVYCINKDVVTRHRAIYYAWLVAIREYDGFVKYADLRSKRMW